MESLLVVQGNISPSEVGKTQAQKIIPILGAKARSEDSLIPQKIINNQDSQPKSKANVNSVVKEHRILRHFPKPTNSDKMEYDYAISPWNDYEYLNSPKASNIDNGLYISEHAMEKMKNKLAAAAEASTKQQSRIDELTAKLVKERTIREGAQNKVLNLEEQLQRSCQEQNSLRRRLHEAKLSQSSSLNTMIKDPAVPLFRKFACKATQTQAPEPLKQEAAARALEWEQFLAKFSLCKQADEAQLKEEDDDHPRRTRDMCTQTILKRRLSKQFHASWVSIENMLKQLQTINALAVNQAVPQPEQDESRSKPTMLEETSSQWRSTAESEFLWCSEGSFTDRSTDSDSSPPSPFQLSKKILSWNQVSSVESAAIAKVEDMLKDLYQNVKNLLLKVKDVEVLNQKLLKHIKQVEAQASGPASPGSTGSPNHASNTYQTDSEPAPFAVATSPMKKTETGEESDLERLPSPNQRQIDREGGKLADFPIKWHGKKTKNNGQFRRVLEATHISDRPNTSDGSTPKTSSFRVPNGNMTGFKTSALSPQLHCPGHGHSNQSAWQHQMFRGRYLRPPSSQRNKSKASSSQRTRSISYASRPNFVNGLTTKRSGPGQHRNPCESGKASNLGTRNPPSVASKKLF